MTDHIGLKWGTLKSWDLNSEKCLELIKQYVDLGVSSVAMSQKDTDVQKELICQLIDNANLCSVHLDWDGIDVSKDEAKKYVREYGDKKENQNDQEEK